MADSDTDDPVILLERALDGRWRGSMDARRTAMLGLVDQIAATEGVLAALPQLYRVRRSISVDQRLQRECEQRFSRWYREVPDHLLLDAAPPRQPAEALREALRRDSPAVPEVRAALTSRADATADWKLHVEVLLLIVQAERRPLLERLRSFGALQRRIPDTARDAHAQLARGVVNAVAASTPDRALADAVLALLDDGGVRGPGFDETRSEMQLAAGADAVAHGDLASACRYLDPVIEAGPRYIWTRALFLLERAFEAADRLPEMRSRLEGARRRSAVDPPTKRAVLERLGVVCFADRDWQAAYRYLTEAYRQLSRLDAADPNALSVYALLAAEHGEYEQADWASIRARIEVSDVRGAGPAFGR